MCEPVIQYDIPENPARYVKILSTSWLSNLQIDTLSLAFEFAVIDDKKRGNDIESKFENPVYQLSSFSQSALDTQG